MEKQNNKRIKVVKWRTKTKPIIDKYIILDGRFSTTPKTSIYSCTRVCRIITKILKSRV